MEQVRVKIKKNGQVEVEVKGHKGSGCSAITKDLQNALGETIDDKKTKEFYEQKTSATQGVSAGGS